MNMNVTKIRAARKKRKLNREDFAALIGYGKESVKKWEQGAKISKRAQILLESIIN